MSIEHTIVIIKQHTTTIQTLFSLIWTTQQEIKGNIFKHQTLSHHIFMNKQPFQKVKASLNSALKDLSKSCINLTKGEGRIHTYFWRAIVHRCFWMLLKCNSCTLGSQMMIDEVGFDSNLCRLMKWSQTRMLWTNLLLPIAYARRGFFFWRMNEVQWFVVCYVMLVWWLVGFWRCKAKWPGEVFEWVCIHEVLMVWLV